MPTARCSTGTFTLRSPSNSARPSTEIDPATPHPVVDLMPDQRGVTDKGLAHLQDITTLRWLRLQGTGIGDGAVATLAAMKGLERLFVDKAAFSADATAALKQALPKLRLVTR